MTDLRDRLRAGDPCRTARPLDPEELAAMRRAMASAQPEPRRFGLVAGLALVATGLLTALLLWPDSLPPPSVPPVVAPAPPVVVAPPAPSTPPPMLAKARPKPVLPKPLPEPAPVRQVRFVTAKGTQIIWTFRSSEEGA